MTKGYSHFLNMIPQGRKGYWCIVLHWKVTAMCAAPYRSLYFDNPRPFGSSLGKHRIVGSQEFQVVHGKLGLPQGRGGKHITRVDSLNMAIKLVFNLKRIRFSFQPKSWKGTTKNPQRNAK